MQKLSTNYLVKGGLFTLLMIFSATCARIGPEADKNRVASNLNGGETTEVPKIADKSAVKPLVLCDFEKGDLAVDWSASTPATAPATTPAIGPATAPTSAPAENQPELSRSSRMVESGLWCLRAKIQHPGLLMHRLTPGINAAGFDTLTVDVMQDSGPDKTGLLLAAAVVEDVHGNRVVGDFYPVTTRWQAVGLDLPTAVQEGLGAGELAAVGVALRYSGATDGSPTIELQTDQWALRGSQRTYVGSRTGVAKSFYVDRQGGRLRIGQVDQWEMTFHQRAITGDPAPGQPRLTGRPWLEVTRGPNQQVVLGQPGTGLMVLDQDQYDALAKAAQRGPATPSAIVASQNAGASLPTSAWPASEATFDWRVAWTSEVGALVEVKQVCGPIDRLGRPAATLAWKFMVYRSGQVYTHVEWTPASAPTKSEPVSWALIADRILVDDNVKEPERLLQGIYPSAFAESTMPHQMQVGNPVAMLAKINAREKNLWWWAETGNRRIFGVGLPKALRQGPLDCLLLVNDPNPLAQASAFSGYLGPANLRVKVGTIDRNFPGDRDNDGLVEPYGFQVVRLTAGRAVFTIDPENRPLYYPAILFTVPAAERDLVDVKNCHVLINLDGKQFEDPPQWPDGSFLLQLPYVISRPVHVEATLVHK